jgi:hypothetical protein
MTLNIEGVEYLIEQREKNSPLAITNVDDRHDWIILGVGVTRKLVISGKGWKGENP